MPGNLGGFFCCSSRNSQLVNFYQPALNSDNDGFGAVGSAQFLKDRDQMLFGAGFGKSQHSGDFLVAQTLAEEFQDFNLAVCEQGGCFGFFDLPQETGRERLPSGMNRKNGSSNIFRFALPRVSKLRF